MGKQEQVSGHRFSQRSVLFVLNGDPVTVTSQYTYQPIFNFLGILSFTMSSSSTMDITN